MQIYQGLNLKKSGKVVMVSISIDLWGSISNRTLTPSKSNFESVCTPMLRAGRKKNDLLSPKWPMVRLCSGIAPDWQSPSFHDESKESWSIFRLLDDSSRMDQSDVDGWLGTDPLSNGVLVRYFFDVSNFGMLVGGRTNVSFLLLLRFSGVAWSTRIFGQLSTKLTNVQSKRFSFVDPNGDESLNKRKKLSVVLRLGVRTADLWLFISRFNEYNVESLFIFFGKYFVQRRTGGDFISGVFRKIESGRRNENFFGIISC